MSSSRHPEVAANSHQMFDLFAGFQNGFGRRTGDIGVRLQTGKR